MFIAAAGGRDRLLLLRKDFRYPLRNRDALGRQAIEAQPGIGLLVPAYDMAVVHGHRQFVALQSSQPAVGRSQHAVTAALDGLAVCGAAANDYGGIFAVLGGPALAERHFCAGSHWLYGGALQDLQLAGIANGTVRNRGIGLLR